MSDVIEEVTSEEEMNEKGSSALMLRVSLK